MTIYKIPPARPLSVAAVAEPVRLAFLWRPLLPDIDDDMVLETAVNGRADWIVTFNWRDFALTEKLFGIAALSPGEAFRRLEEGGLQPKREIALSHLGWAMRRLGR